MHFMIILENILLRFFPSIPLAKFDRLRQGAKSYQDYENSTDKFSEMLWIGLIIIVLIAVIWGANKWKNKKDKF